MQCVTPMFRRYPLGSYKDGKIVPRKEVLQDLNYDQNHISYILDTMNNTTRKKGKGFLYEQIPCQHCWACKLNYSAQWATRIMVECTKSEHNYFITFTYDDNNIPIPSETEYNGQTYVNDGTWMGSLFPQDIDKFMNSLRQYIDRKYGKIYDEEGNRINGIKYFYAGEYGETTKRPHYHMILMNCPLDLNQFYDFHIDERGKMHWKSHEIEKYWDLGMIDIGEVEFASAAYVARYCMKKITDNPDKTKYWKNGMYPEFVRMSRRPGIGMDYYNENWETIYENDKLYVKNFHGQTIEVKPPKAWDKKFKESHPQEWFNIQRSRKEGAERSRKLLQEMTDMSDLQMLHQKAENILIKGKQLPREM